MAKTKKKRVDKLSKTVTIIIVMLKIVVYKFNKDSTIFKDVIENTYFKILRLICLPFYNSIQFY
jgi:hypothetical protein